MNYNLKQLYDNSDNILLSKGENREPAEAALRARGIAVANIDGLNPRCLHIG